MTPTTNNDQGGGQVPRVTLEWTNLSGDGKRAYVEAIENDGWADLRIEVDTDDCDGGHAKAAMQVVIDRCNNYPRLESENRALREALAPLASLLESACISDSDPDDTPLLTSSTPVQVVMGVRKTLVGVGDVRRAAKLLKP
jgi:hypothetical protein